MYPQTLDARIAELDTARAMLLKALDSKTDKQSGWSVTEIAYHLYLAEKQITETLQSLLKQADTSSRPSDDQLREEWEKVVAFLSDKNIRMEAPESVVPINPPPLERTKELLAESRKALLELLSKATLDEVASVSFPHPFRRIGRLSGLGWLSLLAHHERRHALQICDSV
ncbi:MAG: DinB family protein [Acidobacteriota bacterium]|nr:DinB family protein [Blastocatellia bacterium]MDW8413472.1 DinB family protein [Acidobacteriota bacterium]